MTAASAAAASASRISAARTQQVDLEQQDLQAYMDRLEVAENRPGGANAN